MKLTLALSALSLLIICSTGIAQTAGYVYKNYKHDQLGVVYEKIDTLTGDTSRYTTKSDRYVEISKDGVLLVDGHKIACNCEPRPNGYWIERYRNGNLKEQGRYVCNRKTGTWIYYYENGQVAKVENFQKPFPELFSRQLFDWDNLRNPYLREGPYLEYYPNGQLKIEGHYKIIEEFSTTDTLVTYDPDTYEEVYEIIEGEFWLPRSRKSFVWNYYSETGELLSHEIIKIEFWKDETIRDIEARYWEMILKICEEIKKE